MPSSASLSPPITLASATPTTRKPKPSYVATCLRVISLCHAITQRKRGDTPPPEMTPVPRETSISYNLDGGQTGCPRGITSSALVTVQDSRPAQTFCRGLPKLAPLASASECLAWSLQATRRGMLQRYRYGICCRCRCVSSGPDLHSPGPP